MHEYKNEFGIIKRELMQGCTFHLGKQKVGLKLECNNICLCLFHEKQIVGIKDRYFHGNKLKSL